MSPTLNEIYDTAYVPWTNGEIEEVDAIENGAASLKRFMLKHAREKDLLLFNEMSGDPQPAGPEDIPMKTVIPAFIISEVKTAFQIGFVLFLPFLVIDMVVASVLLSMGMMQLPPVMVSLPFKVSPFHHGRRLGVGRFFAGEKLCLKNSLFDSRRRPYTLCCL